MADRWTRRVYATVRRIPPRRVASYGLIALLAGRPRAARAVGTALSACDDGSVPCHRVVRADGRPAFPRHGARLRREGVRFVGARVDMRRHLWLARLPASRAS